MKLRLIRLSGFKTFGPQTQFELDPGITAIVGPNGSGKSNLADAIAWALGEQALSSLRVKRSSELLHQPAAGRRPSRLASVQLVIEDAPDALPAAGSEIELERAGYQDGESEYRLNGQRIRLAQLRALLAPFGLAQRSFTLIRQGRCDQLLSVHPQQRRRVLEEAAGVLGLIHKKEAAERRLARLQDSLAPVHQELRALEASLAQLERQARRFEQRKELVRAMQQAMDAFYAAAFRDADAEASRCDQTLAQLEAQRQEAERQGQAHRAATARLQTRHSQQLQQWERQQARVRSLDEKLHARVRDQDVLVEREKLLAYRQEQNRQRRETADQERQQAAADQERAAARLTTSLEQRQERQAQLDRLLAQEKQRQAVRQHRRRRLDSLSRRLREWETVQATLQQDRALLALERGQQIQALERHARLIQQELDEHAALQAALDAQRKRRQVLEEGHNRLQAQRQAGQETASALAQQEQACSQRLDSIRQARAACQARQTYFEDFLRLSASPLTQTPEGSRALGHLGALLKVAPRYQKAVAACLADWQNSLVFRTWNEARPFVEQAVRQPDPPALRVTVLDLLPPVRAPRLNGRPARRALDVVSGPPEIMRLAHVLLGDYYLVDDVAAAHALLRERSLDAPARIVTLDGDSYPAPGLLKLRHRAETEAPFLQIAYETEAIAKELSRLHRAEERAQQARDDCAASQAQAEAELAARTTAAQKGEREAWQARQQVRHTQAALDKTNARLDLLRREKARIAASIQDLDARLKRNADQAEALPQRIQAVKEDISRQVEESAEPDAQARDAEVAARRGALDKLELAVENAQEQASVLERQLQGLTRTHRQLAEERAALERERQALQADLAATGKAMDALRDQAEAARNALAPLAHPVHAYESQRQALDDALKNHAQRLQALEDQRRTWEIRQAEAAARRTWLTRSLRQDLELLEQTDAPDAEAYAQALPSTLSPAPDAETLAKLRRRLTRAGAGDPNLYREYQATHARQRFLAQQTADLAASAAHLQSVIERLESELATQTRNAFRHVNRSFGDYFQRFFPGGKAWLEMTSDDAPEGPGVDMFVQLPGKPAQSVSALSGGERAMTALALAYAILRYNQPPFCVLDEADAALDEANVERIGTALRELAQDTQFLLITHNQRMLEYADALFGITLDTAVGCSQVLSLQLAPPIDGA